MACIITYENKQYTQKEFEQYFKEHFTEFVDNFLGSKQDIKGFKEFVNSSNINISLLPDSIPSNEVNYTFKSFNILMSDKAKQVFDKGNKNKWSLDKILTELAVPKEQKQLLLDLGIKDREQLALELASKYGYSVEINTATSKTYAEDYFELNQDNYTIAPHDYMDSDGDYISSTIYYKNNEEITYEEYHTAKTQYESKTVPIAYYSNLAVPGGTNYTENEISTPLITPSIKGHAQFSTDNGIGWFRSDDKIDNKTTDLDLKNIYIKEGYDEEMSFDSFKLYYYEKEEINPITNTKTRRILEIQSDLFQKGRDKEDLIKTNNDNYIFRNGKPIGYEKNQFLQLLNKDNNWVTFFIKSIIQDSAKKGYEKVLFPKGETAAKIEGHETLMHEIGELEAEMNNENFNVFNVYTGEYLGKNLSWYEASKILESNKDSEVTGVGKRANDLLNKLDHYKRQGIEKLKPIEAFYEIKVGNILEKVYGKNNVKIITDEYGNSWNEITLSDIDSINISLLPSTINDINDGLSSPSNAPSSGNPINKGVKFQPVIDSYLERVKALRNSIGKLKSLRKKSTDPTEKANIYKRIKNLEKAVYEIVSTDKDNPGLIMQVSKLSALEDIIPYADAQLMNVRSILSGNITIENLKYAEKIVALWTKAGDFSKENLFWSKQDLEDLDVNPALENILKEFSRLKTEADIIKSTIINPIRENIAKKGVEEQFGKEATKQISSLIADVNWATMQTLDISEVNNPLVQAMSSYLKKANFNALQEANEIVETIDKLMSKVGKVDWDLFKQTFSNTDSRETGNLVFRFSQSYFDKRAKMLNIISSTNNTKARNSALKELLKFNKENTLIFDVRKLFSDKFNAIYSQDVIDEHIAELKQALGEIGYNEFYARAEELVGRFLLDKDTQSQIFESEYTKNGVLDNAAYNLALTSWIRQNSPAAEAEAYSLSNKDIDNINVIPNGTYSVKVPKRTINGVNTGYYDNKFSKIEANEDLRELYNTIFNTINELKAVLPYEETKWMRINSLPTVHKTIMDQYAEDGMTAGLQPLIGALAEATRINDVSTIDTRYRNLDTGDPEKSIQTQMLVDYNKRIKEVTRLKIIQYKLSHNNNSPTSEMVREFSRDAANEIAKEKSFDLAKITKMYALMALSFKHKASIQHIMESLEMKVKNSQEGATNNTGAQLYDKQGNPLRLSNKLSNLNQMLETFMDYYYGYKMDKPIGKTTKKVYTPKEKEKKETIDKALELNEEKFNNKEISIEEYESNKEALTEMLELLGGVRTWSKYGDLFLQYVQIKGMGWNVFAGITNMTYGFISNLIEASDGRNYNQEEFWKAQLKVLHTVGGNKFTDEAVKIRSLVKNLDILKASRYEINNPSNQSKFNKGAKVINPYTPQTSTEFLNQATVMVAMMLHTKVSKDGKEITLYDAFDKDGKLLPGVVLPEGFDIASFKITVDKVIKMNHGNYDPDSPINAKRHLLGRALSQFRTWAYQGFAERFMDEMPDYQLGMIRKGRYRSYVDFYKTMKENGNGYISSTFFITKQLLRKATFGVYNTEFNELQGLSEVDAANMRKNMTELVILGMLTAMALLIKGLVDKKKSVPKYLAYFYLNQITRLSTDIMFYTSPSQFEKLTRNAMPAFSAVIDLEDAMRKSINYIVDNESDMIKTGSYKGQSKAFRALNKVVPNPYSGISKVISATESDYSKKPIK